ncbi:MAG: carbamate kinase [Erysipelothrix sp.]|nr:carbamate kinase [Erysipelothrix sp.]
MKKKVVVALGGNALGDTPDKQKEAVKIASSSIVDLVDEGYEVMVVHGNGPQVGMIHMAFDMAHKQTDKIPTMPLVESTAMSQGYIGYHLQNAIVNEMKVRGFNKDVATILTQVVVDQNDPAFLNPNKPVGPFYTKEEADVLSKVENAIYLEDAGRGYRKAVASPKPQTIVEKNTIRKLLNSGTVVISSGGGGMPVVDMGGMFIGVDAVIDKDNSAAKIAEEINADSLIILTAVDNVAIRFGKENQEWLHKLSTEDALKYIEEGEFAAGSMLPKVEASIRFAKSKKGRIAIITSLESAKDAIQNGKGTIITE